MKDEFKVLHYMIDQAEIARAKVEDETNTNYELFSIVQNAPLPFWAKERLSDGNWRMWFVNREYARQFLNNDATTYLNKTDEEVWGPEVAADFLSKDERIWQTKQPELVIEEIPDIDAILQNRTDTPPPKQIFSYKWPVSSGRDFVCGMLIPCISALPEGAAEFIRKSTKELDERANLKNKITKKETDSNGG